MIVCSLNEIEGYGRRAARGAGMTWGLAEEAGKAARWLAAHRLPGAELLAALLSGNDRCRYEPLSPPAAGGPWRAREGELCPIVMGAALADRVETLAGGRAARLGPIRCPLLLAPFLGIAARPGEGVFELRWPGVRMRVLAEGPRMLDGGPGEIAAERADGARIAAAPRARGERTVSPRSSGVEVDDATWQALGALAARTYVPASEASRERGAGAGSTDND